MPGLPTVVAASAATPTTAVPSTATPTLAAVPSYVTSLATLIASPSAAAATSTITTASAIATSPIASAASSISTSSAASATTIATSSATSTIASSSSSSATAGALDWRFVRAGDVDGLGAAFGIGVNKELDGLAEGEAAEAVGSDGGLVDEEFLAAVVGGYEAKTLLVIEPLHLPRYPLLLTLTHRSGSDLYLSLSLLLLSPLAPLKLLLFCAGSFSLVWLHPLI